MSTPILATKLYIPPPQPKIVNRPRLIERLNEGLHRKLTLISAPAGFGKTTLVSEWINQNNEGETMKNGPMAATLHNSSLIIHSSKVAWLSLDDGDNDTTRFLTYLIAALQTVAPTLGSSVLSDLQSPQPPSLEAMLTVLLNDLVTVPDHLLLVLDDYHVIEAKTVDQALIFLLENLPPHMHLVIATREDPPLPLARLRARRQLTELRIADLRFTPAEAASFLNQAMGLSLSADEVAALETRTEGWIVGLQLAALSMQHQHDTANFIKSFTGSHRFVLDYLVEEVLAQQPQPIQTFLLRTSILDRFCGPLCDAVVGDLNSDDWHLPGDDQTVNNLHSQKILEYIEQANLFLVPLDNERQWYRYHHLFADLLRQRLHQSVTSAPADGSPNSAELHTRASQWYEDNGLAIEAIHHALAAEDFERAAGLIELIWPEMDSIFQSASWLGWVKALPDQLVRVRPVLSLGYAWALLSAGEMEAAETRLRDAERWLTSTATATEQSETASHEMNAAEMVVVDETQFRFLPASLATARAYQFQALGDVAGSIEYAQQALDFLPETDYMRRGPPASLLALAHWANGELEAAHRTLAAAMTDFELTGKINFAISGTYGLADIRLAQGRLREAIKIYEQSLRLAASQDETKLRGTADLYLGLANLHRELGAAEIANQHLQQSQTLGEVAGLPDWPYRLCVALARFKQDQDDLASAFELINKAEQLYFRTPMPNVRPVAALKARVWLNQGQLAETLAWAREQGLSVDDDLSYLREFEHITLARILMVQYKHDQADQTMLEALKLLARLLEAAETGERMGSVLEILVLQALAHQAQGDLSLALIPLERALALAEPEGYVRLFIDEGQPMAELLMAAAAQGGRTNYIDKLLAAFDDGSRQERPTVDSSPVATASKSTSLIEPLSQRELEVLQLIAQGLSNREISERLYLALSTVKGHNRIIFGKLQVQRRTEAVARARELGLV